MKKDIFLVTISELLFQAAEGSLLIFGVIFFFQKFDSVFLAIAPFILMHIFHAFLLPFFSKLLFKIGLKNSIFIGSLFYIATALTVFITNGNYTFEILVLWALLYALGNVFHYVPIIYILGSESKHANRGRLFGLRRMIFIIAAIITPLTAGFISQEFGFQGLLIFCIALHLLTNIPIIYLNKIEAHPPKSLVKTLMTMRGKRIFLYKLSEVFTNNMADFWPIFVFIILAGSFSNLGILFAVVSLITVFVTYITGRALDNHSRPRLYFAASLTTFVAWVFRALSFNYITVLCSDLLFKINANFKTQISEVIDYDLMNDHVNQARASVIILSETIVNYAIAILQFGGALAITVFGFQTSFLVFGLIGFIFTQIMRHFLRR